MCLKYLPYGEFGILVFKKSFPAISGSRAGGQKESWAGEDQEPEEEVQTENPGEHSETETAKKETDEEKTDEKERGSAGNCMKTASCIYCTLYNNL